MNSSRKKLLIFMLISICITAVSYFIYRSLPNNKFYEKQFSKIILKDNKEKVILLFGEPTKIEDCPFIKYSEVSQEKKDNCVEIYWYIGLLEEWGFAFDKDGKVIHKLYMISG